MKNKIFRLKSEVDTKKLAEKLAENLKGGEVVGLIGDLGAGKTTFTQYLAAALGVKQTVTSPTFTIMRVYSVTAPFRPISAPRNEIGRESEFGSTIKCFVHIDAYRLASADDLVTLGVEEYFNDSQTVTVIEWAERINSILPDNVIILKFFLNGARRSVVIEYK